MAKPTGARAGPTARGPERQAADQARERVARLGELERPHEPLPIVRVNGGRSDRIELAQAAVSGSRITNDLVADPVAYAGRCGRRQAKVAQLCGLSRVAFEGLG